MDDLEDLEKTLIELIDRKNAAPEGSAERRKALRQIAGLRNRKEAGPIIEDLDPFAWGYC